MEFVSAIISPIIESLIVPVKKQLGYLFFSTKHVRNMNAKMKLLDGTSTDVKKQSDTNNISNLEIPSRVPGWLEDVEKIKKDAQSISSTGNGCFDIKMRYRAGKKAFNITKEMGVLIDENSKIIWRNSQKPLGKVNSKKASTSAPSDGDAEDHFKSREKTFKDALESLQQDHTSKVIALCGMGGVGKTTLMEQLKNTVEDKKMFDYVVKVVIGQQINMLSIQQTVAVYLSQSLPESSVAARADHLRTTCEKMSKGNKKVLVILDDVWETIELKDIGLSPLPNGFKLLLTSRNEDICKQIAVKANLAFRVFRVDVMEELEAQNFFWEIIGVSKKLDQKLNKIGSDIVKRCGFLPLAINLIATTLKFQEEFVWRDTLRRLEKKNLDYVQEVIEISYNCIKEEEGKRIFLLCGLFPDDFDIPIEELTRYAWGLRLLSEVSTLGEARDRTMTCVQSLRSANLLIGSDYVGCVKVHDLVLAFMLGIVSKGDLPWLINHGDVSKWSTAGMSESCKRISMTCKGMSEFPKDFRYPNASLLKLRDGDKSLRFPEDFYEKVENLEVIAYEEMQYPLLPKSLQCFPKLRTLILHQCLLMFDCSAVGELEHLEVLSFAHCGIRKLPAAIGKLKELKLLDLTGCVDLRIDDLVLKNLVKLEELYMKTLGGNAIRFTDGNREEFAECSEHLFALEVEFFENNGKPQNMLFKNLERFRISMGCTLEDDTRENIHSFENTLMLATNQDELLDSRLNELFQKTEVLYLKVDGMNDLEAVQLPQHSFDKLRVLDVFKCANLKYLFTVPMANGLVKLERLTVSQCPDLEVLVYGEKSGDGVIKFQGLKFLSLTELPKLVGICNNDNVSELPELVELTLDGLPTFTSIYPEKTSATSSLSSTDSAIQPFFNTEVSIPKLEILKISNMNKLKDIWAHQVSSSDEVNPCMLREIEVKGCDNIVNLFPVNPMSLLRHLEELRVDECESIEVLFDIDMSCVGEIEKYNSNLRLIFVVSLGKLRELWRVKGVSSSGILMPSFQAVERIEIWECESFVNVFTPSATKSDVRTLMNVSIDGRRLWGESGINIQLVQKCQEVGVASWFLSQYTKRIYIIECQSLTRVFPSYTVGRLDKLEELRISDCKSMVEVFEREEGNSDGVQSSNDVGDGSDDTCTTMTVPRSANMTLLQLPNLTIMYIENCERLEYIFTSSTLESLRNLKELCVEKCEGMQVIVKEDGEHTAEASKTIVFPRLKSLTLAVLPNAKGFFLGKNKFEWKVLEKVKIYGCPEMISFTSGHSVAPKLKYIHTGLGKHSLEECGLNFHLSNPTHETQLPMSSTPEMTKLLQLPWSFSNLVEVDAHRGDKLMDSRVIFPCNELLNLKNLEKLCITDNYGNWSIEEIFEVEEGTNDDVNYIQTQSVVVFHNLKEVSLDKLCKLSHMWKSSPRIVLNFPNLTKVSIDACRLLGHVFTCCMVGSLLQLQELQISDCENMDVIVKQVDDSETRPTEVVFPCLISITLEKLPNLKGFCLGKEAFQWPSLDTLKIKYCPEMTVFTCGQSATPKLKLIDATFGLCDATEDPNSFIKTKQQEGWQF